MKKVIFSLLAVIYSARSGAAALSSIYNGDQYEMAGQLLVQDATNTNKYYFLPQSYKVKRKSLGFDDKGKPKFEYAVTHKVAPNNVPDDQKTSEYNITVQMETPGRATMDRATENLRLKSGNYDAQIVGMAPICGVQISVPGFATAATPTDENAQRERKGPSIQYTFVSTAEGKCDFRGTANEFHIVYSVPLSQEPKAALALTSSAGLSLPPITLILPAMYKDKVELSFNVKNALEILKVGADIKGSFKFVTAQVTGNISNLFSKLDADGSIKVEWHDTDISLRDQYIAMAKDMAMKYFYTFVAEQKDQGNSDPLVVGDNDKSLSMVSAHLAFEQQNVDREKTFRFSLESTAYSSVRTQAQINVRGVSEIVLDSIVLKKLQDARPMSSSQAKP